MPNKQNNIILYTDTESKVNVNVRFDDEKANTRGRLKRSLFFFLLLVVDFFLLLVVEDFAVLFLVCILAR